MRIGKQFVKGLLGGFVSFAIIMVIINALFAVKDAVTINAQDETIEYGKQFTDTAMAILWDYDVSRFMKVEGTVNTNELGEYELKYYCLGNTIKRVVRVIDTESPEIILNGEPVCTVYESILAFEDPGYIVIDNVDKDLQDKVVVKKVCTVEGEKYLAEYTVTDNSGNVGTAKREIIVLPKQEPPEEVQATEESQEAAEVDSNNQDSENERKGMVYLTFDDGPSKLTPEYLKVLKDNGVNATFFVVGFSAEKDGWKLDIMRTAIDEGNVIALHGMSHEYSKIYSSVENTISNFTDENQFLVDNLGINTMVMRFPGGSSNTVSKKYCKGVMSEATKALDELGYNYFDWNVDSNDAGSDVNSSENIYKNVVDSVRQGRNNVILMHDSSHHNATLEALPKIIQELKNAGYEFGTLDVETPSVRHGVNN